MQEALENKISIVAFKGILPYLKLIPLRDILRIMHGEWVIVSKEIGRVIFLLQLGQARQLPLAINVLNGFISTGIIHENGLLRVSRCGSELVAQLFPESVGSLRCGIVASHPSEIDLAISLSVSTKSMEMKLQ